MVVVKDISLKKVALMYVRRVVPNDILDFFIFRIKNGYFPSLSDPKTFNENILYIKKYVKDRRFSYLCDKINVRKYVCNKIGEQYLIPILDTVDSYDDIDWASLGKSFVMKPSNSSGVVYILHDEVPDRKLIRKLFDKWFSLDYSKLSGEWQYKLDNQKIMFEKVLFQKDGSLAKDYKVHCFRRGDGLLNQIVEIHADRFGEHKIYFFDENFNLYSEEDNSDISKPENFDLMLKLSASLCEGFNYVRVDWYNCSGRLYLGELTFTPGNGMSVFNPPKLDEKIGELFG